VTPSVAQTMYLKGLLTNKSTECFSIIIDKVDLHQAFDLDQDLLQLAQNTDNFPKPNDVIFRIIFTTNQKGEHVDEQSRNNYNEIKKGIMGAGPKGKALVIQLNEDQRTVTPFEKINHYYIMCKNDNDKFMMLFTLKKLALVNGKVVIYCTDLLQAYRIKFFFARFQMKAFVLSPEMAK